jgi:hypothetical protein
LFFKPDEEALKQSIADFEELATTLGLRVLGWREVPRDSTILGLLKCLLIWLKEQVADSILSQWGKIHTHLTGEVLNEELVWNTSHHVRTNEADGQLNSSQSAVQHDPQRSRWL